MSYPQNIQIYANMLTKNGDVYRNTSKLFDKILNSADKPLAADIKRDTQKAVVNQKLLARIRAVVADKSGPNRGHRDLRTPAGAFPNGERKDSGKSKGKGNIAGGKGKGKGKGVPNLHQLQLAEDDLFMPLDDGAQPQRIDIDEVH